MKKGTKFPVFGNVSIFLNTKNQTRSEIFTGVATLGCYKVCAPLVGASQYNFAFK